MGQNSIFDLFGGMKNIQPDCLTILLLLLKNTGHNIEDKSAFMRRVDEIRENISCQIKPGDEFQFLVDGRISLEENINRCGFFSFNEFLIKEYGISEEVKDKFFLVTAKLISLETDETEIEEGSQLGDLLELVSLRFLFPKLQSRLGVIAAPINIDKDVYYPCLEKDTDNLNLITQNNLRYFRKNYYRLSITRVEDITLVVG